MKSKIEDLFTFASLDSKRLTQKMQTDPRCTNMEILSTSTIAMFLKVQPGE